MSFFCSENQVHLPQISPFLPEFLEHSLKRTAKAPENRATSQRALSSEPTLDFLDFQGLLNVTFTEGQIYTRKFSSPKTNKKKTNDGPFRLDLPRDGSLLASSSIASVSECPTTSAIRVGCRGGGCIYVFWSLKSIFPGGIGDTKVFACSLVAKKD